MKLEHIEDVIERAINALDKTLSSRLDPLYIEQLIHQARAEAIRNLYNGSRTQGALKKIDGAWVQTFEVDIIDADQDDDNDYLIFDVPAPLQINKNMGGLIYVGSSKKTKGFKVAQGVGEINDLINRGYLENGKDTACVYEPIGLKVWGNMNLKKIKVSAILQNPIDAPNFLVNEDDYPVSEDLINMIQDIVVQKVSVGLRQTPDIIADGADTNSINVTRSNIKQ
jgi:hypothetical protein